MLRPYLRRIRSLTRDGLKFIWGSDGKHELYDLDRDPDELTNLVDSESHAAVRRQMEEELTAWHRNLSPQDQAADHEDLTVLYRCFADDDIEHVDGSVDLDFSWGAVGGAAGYHVVHSAEPGFGDHRVGLGCRPDPAARDRGTLQDEDRGLPTGAGDRLPPETAQSARSQRSRRWRARDHRGP